MDSKRYIQTVQKLQLGSLITEFSLSCMLEKEDPFHIQKKLVGISCNTVVSCKGCGERVTKLNQTEDVNLRFQAATSIKI